MKNIYIKTLAGLVSASFVFVILLMPTNYALADYVYNSQFGISGNGNGQLKGPSDIVQDALGNIYILDSLNSRVQKFDNNGVYISQFGSAGSGNGQFDLPDGGQMTINALGNIYVVDRGNNRVQIFDSTGTYISQFGVLGSSNGEFDQPYGIAVGGSSGNVYVTDIANNRVQIFDSTGTYISQFGTPGSGDGQFDLPLGITLDSLGNIYVADSNNSRIQKFDSSGVFIDKFGSFGALNGKLSTALVDLDLDSSGNIYVFDLGNTRVQGFDSSYNFLETFGASGAGNGQFNYGGIATGGLFIENDGDLFVAEYDNERVQKFILDIVPPTGVLSTPSLSVTAPFTVTLTASEIIEGLNLSDFVVTNGVASNLTGSGAGPYTLTITPFASGVVTIQVPASRFTDMSGNMNPATNLLSVTYTGVTVTANFCPISKWLSGDAAHDYVTTLTHVQTSDGVFSSGDPIYVVGDVPHSEVTALGFDFSSIPATATIVDVTLNSEWKANEIFGLNDREILYAHFGPYNTNVALASLYPPGSTAVVNVHNPTDVITVGEVKSSSATLATIPTRSQLQTMYLVAFNDGHVGFDYGCAQVSYVLPPTATLSTPASTVTEPFMVTFTPDQVVTGLTLGDFTVTNGVASNLTGSGAGPYTVLITPTAYGTVTVVVPIATFENGYPLSNTVATNILSVLYKKKSSGGGGKACPLGTTGIYPNCYSVNPVDPSGGNTTSGKTYISPIDGSTQICQPFNKYLRIDWPANDTQEVKLWQAFLNKYMNEHLPVTGYFGNLTFAAVKRFQSRHDAEILTPWNLSTPTGFIYKSTRLHANKILGCLEGEVTLDNGVVIK